VSGFSSDPLLTLLCFFMEQGIACLIRTDGEFLRYSVLRSAVADCFGPEARSYVSQGCLEMILPTQINENKRGSVYRTEQLPDGRQIGSNRAIRSPGITSA
jgi:hypothetical protein